MLLRLKCGNNYIEQCECRLFLNSKKKESLLIAYRVINTCRLVRAGILISKLIKSE